MYALHLEMAGGPVIKLFGESCGSLRLIATDLLRFKRYLAARLYDPGERLVEQIVA